MAIGLLVEQVSQESVNNFTPIATQSTFEKYWLPICEKYNFQWIPLFETGASFNQDDLPFILDEVKRFAEIVSQNNEPFDEDYKQILIRLNLLISHLEQLVGKHSTFFIG